MNLTLKPATTGVSPGTGLPVALLVGSVLLAAGCTRTEPAPPAVPLVFVQTVASSSETGVVRLPASVRPRLESDLAFRAGGLLRERSVDVGAAVKAGQVLATLDTGDLQLGERAAEDQAQAAKVDAEQAAREVARLERLVADGSAGAADLERQRARLDAARARAAQATRQQELARNRQQYGQLRAPFDGVVTAWRVDVGTVVGEGLPVVSVARAGDLEIAVEVPETLLPQLKARPATASIGATGLFDAALKLREIAPASTGAGRLFRVRYALGAMPPGTPPPAIGMSAEVALRDAVSAASSTSASGAPASIAAKAATTAPATSASTLASTRLPASALVKSTDRPFVWRVEGDPAKATLKPVPVVVQAQGNDWVRVSGLPEGTRVVSLGAQRLREGLAVRWAEQPVASMGDARPVQRP